MSWLSNILGTGPAKNAMDGDLGKRYMRALTDYSDPMHGSGELSTMIQDQVASAMPQFNRALSGVRQNAIQRGLSTGDLGTSYEGDLASTFQRNIAHAISGQSYDLFQSNRNNYLDLLSGGLDREQDRNNQNANRKGGFFNSLLGGAGMVLGGLL